MGPLTFLKLAGGSDFVDPIDGRTGAPFDLLPRIGLDLVDTLAQLDQLRIDLRGDVLHLDETLGRGRVRGG